MEIRVRRSVCGTAVLSGLLALNGCGASLDTLNRLASAGSIHEDAPVTAHVQIEIDAPPAKVWALLIDAPSWPKWQRSIESVEPAGALEKGMRFAWRTGGMDIHSQVQLFELDSQLSWTGTAITAKAVHVWELKAEPNNRTMVTVKESMDGPLMAKFYPSSKLAQADIDWLLALKAEAEQKP